LVFFSRHRPALVFFHCQLSRTRAPLLLRKDDYVADGWWVSEKLLRDSIVLPPSPAHRLFLCPVGHSYSRSFGRGNSFRSRTPIYRRTVRIGALFIASTHSNNSLSKTHVLHQARLGSWRLFLPTWIAGPRPGLILFARARTLCPTLHGVC